MGAMVLKLLNFKASGDDMCCRNMEFIFFLDVLWVIGRFSLYQ